MRVSVSGGCNSVVNPHSKRETRRCSSWRSRLADDRLKARSASGHRTAIKRVEKFFLGPFLARQELNIIDSGWGREFLEQVKHCKQVMAKIRITEYLI